MDVGRSIYGGGLTDEGGKEGGGEGRLKREGRCQLRFPAGWSCQLFTNSSAYLERPQVVELEDDVMVGGRERVARSHLVPLSDRKSVV